MLGKKLLYIQECQFSLPVDFEGTLGDALMLLAKHRLNSELNQKVNRKGNDIDGYEELKKDNDISCCIKYALCKSSKDGTKWDTL